MSTMIQYVLYLAILVVLAIPLGAYIKNVMSGEKTFLSKVLTPCENLIYKVIRVDREEQMTWKKYAVSVMIFSGIGLVFLFLLQLLQGVLPGNPQHLSGVKWDLAFNTSASFITNTNWQAYSGESTLSYLTQALGLTVQNFVSAATGIAVLFALIRGFIKVKSSGLGSFWVDLTRIVVHILLPLNLVISLLLVGGVIQNLKSAETVSLVEPIAVSAEGEILEDAVIDLDTETVTVDGEIVSNAQIVTEQFVPMGPAASQVAIKQTGTNGGGYMGVNSAHPLENPNAFTNLIEMISILLIPAALCFTFGSAVKNKRQGIAIFMAMFLCLVVALGCIAVTEQAGTSQLAQNGAVNNKRLAQQLGATIETSYGDDVPVQIAEFARLSGISKIVIGRSTIARKNIFSKPTLTERLISSVPNLDIHVIPDASTATSYQEKKRKAQVDAMPLRDVLKSTTGPFSM